MPRVCTCGHPEGDHKSSQSRLNPKAGMCFRCLCRLFVEAQPEPEAEER